MRFFLSLSLGLASLAIAQTLPNAVPMPQPEIQYLNAAGQPLAGAFLCTYAAGTTTPQATYTDSTAGTANSNPVVLDSAGRASVWIGPNLYKFVLYVGGNGACPGSGTVQWSQDNVTDTTLYFVNYVQSLMLTDANTATFTASGTGAVTRTIASVFNETVRVTDYGAVCDGTTNDYAAINHALAVLPATGGTIMFPSGVVCAYSPGLVITKPAVTFMAPGNYQFVTQAAPTTNLKATDSTTNGITITSGAGAQGFQMIGMGIEYPDTGGGQAANPGAPTLSATSGSLSAGTYYGRVECAYPNGFTKWSDETSVVVGASGGYGIAAPTCPGASGWIPLASSNPGNEVPQIASPMSLASNFTVHSLVAFGTPSNSNNTANCAVWSNAFVTFRGARIFTDIETPPGAPSNGLCLAGAGNVVDRSQISGFNYGVLTGQGPNNNTFTQTIFTVNNYAAVVDSFGSAVNFFYNDEEFNNSGGFLIISGNPVQGIGNYHEQQTISGAVPFNWQIGDNTTFPTLAGQGFAPSSVSLKGEFLQCGGTIGPAPLIIDGGFNIDIRDNWFSACQNKVNGVVDNVAQNLNTGIGFRQNVAHPGLATGTIGWFSHMEGVVDYDFNQAGNDELLGDHFDINLQVFPFTFALVSDLNLTGSYQDLTGMTYTIPLKGTYVVWVNYLANIFNGDNISFQLKYNGSPTATGPSILSNNSANPENITSGYHWMFITAAVGDVIQMEAVSGNALASSIKGGGFTTMSIFRVGK